MPRRQILSVSDLSEFEINIIKLTIEGLSVKEIAYRLGCSQNRVEKCFDRSDGRSFFKRIEGVTNKVQLAIWFENNSRQQNKEIDQQKQSSDTAIDGLSVEKDGSAFPPKRRNIFIATALAMASMVSLLLFQNLQSHYFQIQNVFTINSDLFVELCGHTQTPFNFVIQNETTGDSWQAPGSSLNNECRDYKVVLAIPNNDTWYAIDVTTDNGRYRAYMRCKTSVDNSVFCADPAIEGPVENFMSHLPKVWQESRTPDPYIRIKSMI